MDHKEKQIVLALGIIAACVFLMALAVFGYRRLSERYAANAQASRETVSSSETSDEPSDSSENQEVSSQSSSNGYTFSHSSETSETSESSAAQESSQGSQAAEESSADSSEANSTEEVYDTAPDFQMQDMNGNTVKLSDYFGKPIVLNFWATWCGPCQMEMPHFNEAYQLYGDEVTFLIVNLTDGSRDTVESATSFIEEQGYSFPIFFDVEYDGVYAYGINSIPTTYFLDEHGVIVDSQIGTLTYDSLMRRLDLIME